MMTSFWIEHSKIGFGSVITIGIVFSYLAMRGMVWLMYKWACWRAECEERSEP